MHADLGIKTISVLRIIKNWQKLGETNLYIISFLYTDKMHDSCGETIGGADRGGILTFNSELLPAAYQYDCRVSIKPRYFGLQHSPGILFHFSEIEIGGYCQYSNLTVIDGSIHQLTLVTGMENTFTDSCLWYGWYPAVESDANT